MEKKILRVFPHRNNYTPNDDMVRIGFPDMLPLPDHDEVHISCTFTWDKELCEQMKLSWEMKTDKPVLLGGGGLWFSCGRIHSWDVHCQGSDIHFKRMQ